MDMSDDADIGALTDEEFVVVEHPHEEATHVDRPRYTSPVSDVDETENPGYRPPAHAEFLNSYS